MLEVLHLTKIYKTKGGVETKALNDVSLRFPETGMVFLLGKSGSGKSTLLNVCGGLDSPTSGEVIVKGRSSKNFSQSDFDSYRNTFIGFVFQEYNILNEFTVEDNIALALELQGKPKDKKAIKALLEDVDLGSFAKRKPNTLSGGQKQRIAIARALIKHPEIIMADEPTGALDSNTGKQVFDTLKKLSKKKLVIVVSHDRDFAEEYADRIIELKDGRILSDVTKAEAAAQAVGESKNIEIIGENTLSVKNGAALTQADYQYIFSFLSKNEAAMISSGKKEIEDFKKVSHITERGSKEYFSDTNEKNIPKKNYDGKKTKFIRSKLPMRHAFRIGVSGLKSKPFRLIFTILLCSISFIMFGLFSTLMLYDRNETLYQTLDDAGVNVLHVDKVYKYLETNTYVSDGETETNTREESAHSRSTDSELKKIADVFGNEAFGVAALQNSSYYYGVYSPNPTTINSINTSDFGDYYTASLFYSGYLPENHAFRTKRNTQIGRYPTADDEVWISSYVASVLVKAQYDGATKTEQLLGKTISFRTSNGSFDKTVNYKISGVFNSDDNELSSRYESLKEKLKTSASNEEKEKRRDDLVSFSAALADGYHGIVFFTEKTANELRNASKPQDFAISQELNNAWNRSLWFTKMEDQTEEGVYDRASYYKASLLQRVGETVWLNGKTELSNGESVISLSFFASFLRENRYLTPEYETLTALSYEISGQYGVSPDETGNWLCGENLPLPSEAERYQSYQALCALTAEGGKYETFAKQYRFAYKQFAVPEISATLKLPMSNWLDSISRGYIEDFVSDEYVQMALDQSQITAAITVICDKFTSTFGNLTFDCQVVVNGSNGNERVETPKTFAIAGILSPSSSVQRNHMVFLSEADYNAFAEISDLYGGQDYRYTTKYTYTYVEPADAKYDAIFLPYSSQHRNDLSMFSYEFGADDTRFAIGNMQGQLLETVNNIVEDLSTIFMWIGIVLAAFSMLLLSNFIATSISYKKREIGILRAVGARGADVFKIFYSESLVIAMICFALGITGSIFGCKIVNGEIAEVLGSSLLVFGGASIAILLGIALVTSAAATFLPVFSAARKKPVEAIRSL